MTVKIHSIRLVFPFQASTVNTYLVEMEDGFVLIDTGLRSQRKALLKALEGAGCRPGGLKLVILTHGDFDHANNAAYLRSAFGARVLMHSGDVGMVQKGDMFWNRKTGSRFLRWLAPLLFGPRKVDLFTPDILLNDDSDLAAFGFAARALSIPGHSLGSLGILVDGVEIPGGPGRALFCGDLFQARGRPMLNAIMDDPVAAHASLEKLKALNIDLVYPGHGRPFNFAEIRV